MAHIARISGLTTLDTLKRLIAAGLDSLPGAGAEILDPGVRKAISPAKPSVEEWIQVMHEAHCLNLPTSATMMYGHVETSRQRVDHLLRIRDLQARCPEGHYGFLAFIPWIFRSSGTELERQGVATRFSPLEYIRIIAVSRLVLNNIRNIQASWLTVGKATAQVALHSGANDMGSIMIEENVVSSAGAHNQFDAAGIQNLHRARTTDAIDGSQTDHGVLLRRNVNTGNTSHLCLPQLALTLLVTRVFADHSHNTLALDDLALAAHFLD